MISHFSTSILSLTFFSFFSSHIFHSSTNHFTSTIPIFFCFFLFFTFSSSFCFCYSAFLYTGLHYLLYHSGHLIIFTSSIFQLIFGLCQTSHSMPKITPHFCLSITFISVLSLCPFVEYINFYCILNWVFLIKCSIYIPYIYWFFNFL